MISKIPNELWEKPDLSILDPCCGNGNFYIPIMFELLKHHDKQKILEEILEFNDIKFLNFVCQELFFELAILPQALFSFL